MILLWLITWSISWIGWQIHSLSIHGWFHKINVILVHIWKVFFTLHVTVCTRVMVVNEFGTRLTVLLFVTKVLGTCTWLKKYLMYLMPSKYCEYLYLYLQIWKVLVLDSSTAKSTWPQPWYWALYVKYYFLFVSKEQSDVAARLPKNGTNDSTKVLLLRVVISLM